jgi:transposase
MKAGDRVKTDRRDALMLAKLHRAGELTAIWIVNSLPTTTPFSRPIATPVKHMGLAYPRSA